MIYELMRNRIHVLNLAVHPDYQRRGVGSQMVAKLIGKLSAQRRSRVVLEVRETNVPAQLFFRENGFPRHLDPARLLPRHARGRLPHAVRYRTQQVFPSDSPTRIGRLAG